MAVAFPEVVSAPPVSDPHERRFNRAEFQHMDACGWFQGTKAELVRGTVVVSSPQTFPHVRAVRRCFQALETAFGTDYVAMQAPLVLSDEDEPEPDLYVVPQTFNEIAEHPSTASLIVEISQRTLAFDRRAKARLYAGAGIADYWIVNLVDHRLEVHREPQPGPDGRADARYRSVTFVPLEDGISPLARPGVGIPVRELFP